MKYQLSSHPTKETVSLQSVGHVIGEPAKNLKVGSVTMWNFGSTSTVIEIVSETAQFLNVKFKSDNSDYIGMRRLKKDRLIVILK
jgi:hypothetical protein